MKSSALRDQSGIVPCHASDNMSCSLPKALVLLLVCFDWLPNVVCILCSAVGKWVGRRCNFVSTLFLMELFLPTCYVGIAFFHCRVCLLSEGRLGYGICTSLSPHIIIIKNINIPFFNSRCPQSSLPLVPQYFPLWDSLLTELCRHPNDIWATLALCQHLWFINWRAGFYSGRAVLGPVYREMHWRISRVESLHAQFLDLGWTNS